MPLSSSKSHRDLAASVQLSGSALDAFRTPATLTRLETHAAVRLDPLLGRAFDYYGLPQRRTDKHKSSHFSFIKSVKGLASYLTTSINPSFQECLVRIVESESDVWLEVRPVSTGKAARSRVLFAASLSTLVDVVRDAVIEKDTVVFSALSSSHPSAAEAGGDRHGRRRSTAPSPTGATPPGRPASTPRSATAGSGGNGGVGGAASKKEELISTLFSAYGDIGLNLTFHAVRRGEDERRSRSSAAAAADAGFSSSTSFSKSAAGHGGSGPAARPYTRVGLRFVSTAERNEWLSFCREAYMGLLLDSIRTNRDTVYVAAAGDGLSSGNNNNNSNIGGGGRDGRAPLAASAAPAAAVGGVGSARLEKPSEDVVESYIDFFLSARTRVDAAGGAGPGSGGDGNGTSGGGAGGLGAGVDPYVVPFNGALCIRSADGALHHREVHVEEAVEADSAGMATTRAYLVFLRKRWSGKRESQRIPLEGLQIYAEDDQTGTSFFIEFCPPQSTSAADQQRQQSLVTLCQSERTSAAHQAYTLGAMRQSFLRGTEMASAQDTVSFEWEAGSFAARQQWLQWFEGALRKPVVFLSVERRNAEAQKPIERGAHTGLFGDRVVW